jgi:hypothetical protein
MAKKIFEQYDKNPDHIPGIYNYCDRWCERCPFTSRCLNFEMSEDKFGDLQDGDINNEVFWQRLSETLQETMSMLKEMAEERGVDLDALDLEDAQDMENPFEEKPVVHMASHMAKSYIDTVENWFNDNVYIFEDDARQMAAAYEAESSESQLQEDTVTLIDSVEVIRWYQHQIYVKLQNVVLIGMDRSISAWGKMTKYFPDQKENILNLITHLDRLRRRSEKKFPEARSFVRPGFDDNESEDSYSAEKNE